MSLDPNVVSKLVPAPADFGALGVAAFDGWNGPFWSTINPAFVDAEGETGGTLMESITRSNTQANIPIIAANRPDTFLIGNEHWYTPSALKLTDANGREYSIPAGAMLVREVQGASAYVPPVAPPKALKAVFGAAQNNGNPIMLSSGSSCLVWTCGNGTTYPKGATFMAGVGDANSTFMNPDGPLPPYGAYTIIQWGMGQAIRSV